MRFRSFEVPFCIALFSAPTLAHAEPLKQAQARYEEGRNFARNGDWESARQSFVQAHVLDPKSSTFLWNLAVSEMKSKHPLPALKHFR